MGTSVVAVQSDSNGNPIIRIEKKNGKKIVCTYYQTLGKYYHPDVHVLEFPNRFSKEHARALTTDSRAAYIEGTVLGEKFSNS